MLFKHLKVYSMYSIHLKVYTSCHLEIDATDYLVNTLQSHYNLRQHSCKPRVLSLSHSRSSSLVMPTGCYRRELSQNELALLSGRAIAGVAPEAPAQPHNGRQAHLVHYLFDSLRSHFVICSMMVLSAAQVLLQSSAGRAPRAVAKASVASNAGCVVGA